MSTRNIYTDIDLENRILIDLDTYVRKRVNVYVTGKMGKANNNCVYVLHNIFHLESKDDILMKQVIKIIDKIDFSEPKLSAEDRYLYLLEAMDLIDGVNLIDYR